MANDEQTIRLTLKEWLLFVFASAIALAAFRADDAAIVTVMLTASAAAFVWLCIRHEGAKLWRGAAALLLVGTLAIVGWCDLRIKPHPAAPIADRNGIPPPNATITITPTVALSPRNPAVEPTPDSPSRIPSKPSTTQKRVATTQDEITRLLVEQLQVNSSSIRPDADLVLDLGATPLDKIEIIMQIEEAYDLRIPSSDAQKLKSVGSLVKYIDDHKHGTTPSDAR